MSRKKTPVPNPKICRGCQVLVTGGSFRGQMAVVLRRTGNLWTVMLTTGAQLAMCPSSLRRTDAGRES